MLCGGRILSSVRWCHTAVVHLWYDYIPFSGSLKDKIRENIFINHIYFLNGLIQRLGNPKAHHPTVPIFKLLLHKQNLLNKKPHCGNSKPSNKTNTTKHGQKG